MATELTDTETRVARMTDDAPNGAAMAAFLAAGIGSFAMGLFVLLDATGLFSAPSLYEPAGGLSGRSTFAVIVWLLSWALLHRRWNAREIEWRPAFGLMLLLIGTALIATFPPIWGLFER